MPPSLRGRCSTSVQRRGTLNGARRSRHQAAIAATLQKVPEYAVLFKVVYKADPTPETIVATSVITRVKASTRPSMVKFQ